MKQFETIMGYPIYELDDYDMRVGGHEGRISLPKHVLDIIFDKDWRERHGCVIPIKKELSREKEYGIISGSGSFDSEGPGFLAIEESGIRHLQLKNFQSLKD